MTKLLPADWQQLIINNAELNENGNKNRPENLQRFNYTQMYHSSLFTHNFSLFFFSLAPHTLNSELCTSNHSLTLYPETEVNGIIANNNIWQRERHYIVTGDVIVPQNSSLIIEPGAAVRFDGYYELKVEGTLQCKGEPDDMVMFTSNQEPPTSEDWNRLELVGVDSALALSYTKIRSVTNGILCKRASSRITKTCIRQSAEVGILIANESAPTIEYNLVFNANTGIGVEGGSESKLSYNIIANESKETLSGTGVINNASTAKIEDNIILNYNKGLRTEYGREPYVKYNLSYSQFVKRV